MKKRRLMPGLIVASILGALIVSVYASVKPCTDYWNGCQGLCGGSPSLIVHGDGQQQVQCTNSHWPCELGTWVSPYCEGD
jgi:hypothetical protein